MASAIDKILESIKEFDAENASIGNNPYDPFPGVASTHAQCGRTYREGMKVLISEWKGKVAELKAANDPNPEFDAASAMQTSFMNLQSAFMRCMRTPLHLQETPSGSKEFH
jgi:hypothetical protein